MTEEALVLVEGRRQRRGRRRLTSIHALGWPCWVVPLSVHLLLTPQEAEYQEQENTEHQCYNEKQEQFIIFIFKKKKKQKHHQQQNHPSSEN